MIQNLILEPWDNNSRPSVKAMILCNYNYSSSSEKDKVLCKFECLCSLEWKYLVLQYWWDCQCYTNCEKFDSVFWFIFSTISFFLYTRINNWHESRTRQNYIISNWVFTPSHFSFNFTSTLQLCIFFKHKLDCLNMSSNTFHGSVKYLKGIR